MAGHVYVTPALARFAGFTGVQNDAEMTQLPTPWTGSAQGQPIRRRSTKWQVEVPQGCFDRTN